MVACLVWWQFHVDTKAALIRVSARRTLKAQDAQTMNDMEAAAREELLTLFPELATETGRNGYTCARLSLTAREVRAMFAGQKMAA